MKRVSVALICCCCASAVSAQDLVTVGPGTRAIIADGGNTAPDFGIVAYDRDGQPVDFFGPATPYKAVGGNIAIKGYTQPEGGSIELKSGLAWSLEYARAARSNPEVMAAVEDETTRRVRDAVRTVNNATDLVTAEMCESKGHPAKFAFEIEAGFNAGMTGNTKISVEWDLEAICARYEDAATR